MSDILTEDEVYKIIKEIDLTANDETEDGLSKSRNESECLVSVENNTIKIHMPVNCGTPPKVKALEPVKLKKNSQPMTDEFVVNSDDQLEWDIEEKPLFKIEVSDDNMNAWLRIFSKERYLWRLKDKAPANRLTIEAEEDKSSVVETLKIADIIKDLNDKSIITMNAEKIMHELDRPSFSSVLIAQGMYPIPGCDAMVDLFFNESIESSFEEINGIIDYRNHLKIPSAQVGEVVARKIPVDPGKPGYDIYGKVVNPARPKDIILVAKHNVRITPEGEVIALREGRPRMTGETIKFFDMTTSHVVSGNVDLETGNIVFSGDVIVYGNVNDGMIIEALGSVYIFGNVYKATVTATGSIYVKENVIGSHLYSGHYGVLYNRLYNYSMKLNIQLENLKNTANHLITLIESQGKTIPVGQSCQLLIETKFKEIPDLLKEIIVCITNIQHIHRDHLNDLKEKLHVLLQPWMLLKMDSTAFLAELQHLLIVTSESIKRSAETTVKTDMAQCHLSTIMSNGDILIRREGVLQSHLFSKRNIVFYNKNAVCRGSLVEADHMISAMYVGGQFGGESTLKAGTKVTVHKMYCGRVFIKRFSEEIVEPVEDVQFYVKDNRLVIESHSEAERGTRLIEE